MTYLYQFARTPHRDRIDEFMMMLDFDLDTATALVDAGYVLHPGRFSQSSSESVNGAASPKRLHDGDPRTTPERNAALSLPPEAGAR